MKKLILALALFGLIGNVALYADEASSKQPAPEAAGQTQAAPTAEQKIAKVSHKVRRHEARQECLKETPGLKGKGLKECIKSKLGK